MIEVTQSNFNYFYPQVLFAIENCDFIAIDAEFSGLCLDTKLRPSLFDNSAERYKKQKSSVSNFSLLQFGLTTFRGNTAENQYDVSSYNFHLCPFSFCSNDPILSFQASSLEFLDKHHFDFNKCFNEGIPYLNRKQEKQAIEDLNKGPQVHTPDSYDWEEVVQNVCSLVAQWISTDKSEQFLTIPLEEVSPPSLILIHNELRKRFYQIWTSTNQFNQIVVQKVSPEGRKHYENANKESEEAGRNQRLRDALGFTRIFRILERVKKPIIGHNMFLDLLYMYDKFHNPLPESFTKYKQDIHEMFPLIYDTKHLYHSLRKELQILKMARLRKLDDLHALLNSQKAFGLALMHPSIRKVVNEDSTDESSNAPHHAGYDSFQCGSVFLRLSHLTHFRKLKHTEMNVVPFRAYLSTLKDYTNCVNVIRATISHVKFGGEEPESERPPLLHVSVVSSKELLAPNQLTMWFSVYGTVDIRMIGSRQAIVATSHYNVARDILYSFKKHPLIRVTRYKFWQHSPLGKFIWWSSFLAASGSCMALLIDALRK